MAIHFGNGEGDGLRWRWIVGGLLLMAGLAAAAPARAQVSFDADKGGLIISAGATGSGERLQYGDRKMLGISGFVDMDTRRRFGIEAEGRWLEWRQTTDVHLETYSVGGRYHFDVRRFQPYAKGLVGFGDFNFPYNLATGRYLVITAGGGLDFSLTKRIRIRAMDFEYQQWPQFTYGAMPAESVSTGIRVRLF